MAEGKLNCHLQMRRGVYTGNFTLRCVAQPERRSSRARSQLAISARFFAWKSKFRVTL